MLRGLLLVTLVAWPAFVSARENDARRYPLALEPLEILDRLKELPFNVAPKLPADERAFLEKIWKLQQDQSTGPTVDDETLLNAMLFASGINGDAAMKAYRNKFESLVTRAGESLKNAGNGRDRAERLLAFLHKDVMSKGYELHQSSFAEVFETGKFNCVSATAMYYLVAKRLGLPVIPITIPGGSSLCGHATADLEDGSKRIQVECTNPNGFDWETKLNQPGVIVIGFVPNRKDGHDVDGLGVAAMIYSNRGAGMKDDIAGQLEAVRYYAPALVLDPADKTVRNNLTAGFINGGPKLAKAGKHEEATKLLEFGLAFSPDSRDLANNRGIVWSEHIEALLVAGKDKEALEAIRRGAKEMPDAVEFKTAAVWFGRAGRKLIRDKGWEEGLKLADRGEKVLAGDEIFKLHEWRCETCRHWSDSLLEKGDVNGSMKALARGYATSPKNRQITEAIAFHTQESLWIVRKKAGIPAMLEHFALLQKEFPTVGEIAQVGWGHALNSTGEIRKAGKFAEALDHLRELELLLGKPEHREKAVAIVYDSWARTLVEQKEWTKALDKYKEAMTACPGQDWLGGNSVALVDHWAGPSVNAGNWEEAVRIYKLGETYHPKSSHLARNRDYCEKMRGGGR